MPDPPDSESSPMSPSSYGSGSEAGSPSNARQSDDESCGSCDHQDLDSRGLRGNSGGGMLVNVDWSTPESADESGREETFEDAADDLAEADYGAGLEESMAVSEIGERSGETLGDDHLARVKVRLEDAIAECRKYKEEREVLGKEVVSLRKNLQDIFDHHSFRDAVEDDSSVNLPQLGTVARENRPLLSPLPLHSMLKDCSKFLVDLKDILDERIGSESLIRELHLSLIEKDRQIENLNAKDLESSISRDVIDSYFCSVREAWSKYVEESTDVTKRLLSSLGLVAGQGDAYAEDHPIEDLLLVEKQILSLINTNSQFWWEIHLLHQCLSQVQPAFGTLEHYEASKVFHFAREQLFENKRREIHLQEKLDRLEEENKKLIEQVQKTKMSLEAAHMETNKAKAEVQQAEKKFMAAKERLGIAVTKGKSLVQHRDQLKQFLAEKTGELEICMIELQQKSEALQASEASLEELKQSLHERTCDLEKCLEELQHKTDDLQAAKDSLEELKQLLHKRANELEKCLEELQHKNDDLETAKASVENLNSTFSLLNSLQESLSQKDKCLQEIEAVMSLMDFPEEMLSTETIGKIRWFINQKNITDTIVLENKKTRDAMSLIELPEDISSRELDYQINWLVTEFGHCKYTISKLQGENNGAQLTMASQVSEMLESHKEIDRLKSYLLEEKLANENLHNELEELKCQYDETVQKLSKASSDKEQLIKVLLELSESALDDQIPRDVSSTAEKCMIKISEKMKPSLTQMEHLERMQNRLYLADLQLKLHEKILEDEMVDRSYMTILTDELMKLSNETTVLNNEKDSIQKELEGSEEKNSLLKGKLSMAVKKGKGLVQERESLKLSLEEKIVEIECLKHELHLKDSSINGYQDQIDNLSANAGHSEEIEKNILKLKDERDQIQQSLHESSTKLRDLVTSVEKIALPTVNIFEGPLEKVNEISFYIQQLEEKVHAVEELHKVKEQASLHASRLADASEYNESLEDELSKAENHISFLFEEKNVIQLGKVSVEQELEKLKEESSSSAIKLSEAYTAAKTLEDALAKAGMTIAQLNIDKTQLETKSEHEVFELNAKLNACRVELAGARGSLQDYSAEMNSHFQQLLLLIKDESHFSVIANQFSKMIEELTKINSIIQNIHHQFASKGLHEFPVMEHDPTFEKVPSLPKFEDFANNWVAPFAKDSEDAPFLTKIVGGLHARDELFGNYLEVFCKGLGKYTSSIFQAVLVTNEKLVHVLELSESLKLDVHKLEAHNEAQTKKFSCIQNETAGLLAACIDTTRHLSEICDLRDPSSALEMENFSRVTEEDTESYANAADSLILAAKRIKNQFQKLSNSEKVWLTSSDEMKNKLEEAELIAITATNESMTTQERVYTLERNLEVLNELCDDLKVKLEKYQSKEDMLRCKEEELLSWQDTLDRGLSGQQTSVNQINFLKDKVNKLEITSIKSAKSHPEVDLSDPVEKLCFIVDVVIDIQQKMDILACEKEDMQSTLVSQIHEIESLKEEAEVNYTRYQELELKKNELLDMNDGLERIIKKLGGYDTFQDQKPFSAKLLLTVLERLATTSALESENFKCRAQDLGAILQEKDSLIHELSGKIKLLEDSVHARCMQQEITKEATVFEATPTAMVPEISEIEDVGPMGKNTKSPVSSAAQLRTMKKGSTDHLILNIDAAPDQSVSLETDDKGHVFKSLNTSGVIPKQGKLVADRVDGIWVSGSQLLMRKPAARLGLIAYSFLIHLWLLGTIL